MTNSLDNQETTNTRLYNFYSARIGNIAIPIYYYDDITEFRKDKNLNDLEGYSSNFFVKTNELPENIELYIEDTIVQKPYPEILSLKNLNKIIFNKKTYNRFIDSWGNYFFITFTKVVNPEFNFTLNKIIKIWELVIKESENVQFENNIKSLIGITLFEKFMAIINLYKQHPILQEISEGFNLREYVNSKNMQYQDLELKKQMETILSSGDNVLIENINLIISKISLGESLTLEEEILLEGLLYKNILMNWGANLNSERVLNDFTQRYALANLIENYIVGDNLEANKALSMHIEEYRLFASYAQSNYLSQTGDFILEVSNLEIQFAIKTSSVGGNVHALYLDKYDSVKNIKYLLNHERLHLLLTKARLSPKATLQEESDLKFEKCEEGFVDALSILISFNGDLNKSIQFLDNNDGAYVMAVYAIFQLVKELNQRGGNGYLSLIKGVQAIIDGEGNNPLLKLAKDYDSVMGMGSFNKKMQAFSDLSKPLYIRAIKRKKEEGLVLDVFKIIDLINSFDLQDFKSFLEEESEDESSSQWYLKDENFNRFKERELKGVKEFNVFSFTLINTDSLYQKYLIKRLNNNQEALTQVNDLIKNRYNNYYLSLKDQLL